MKINIKEIRSINVKEVKTINTSYTDAPTYEKIKVAITLRDGLDPDYVPVNYSGEKIDDNNVYIVTTADRCKHKRFPRSA